MDSLRASLLVRRRGNFEGGAGAPPPKFSANSHKVSLLAGGLSSAQCYPRFKRLRTYVFVFSHIRGHGTGKKRTGNSARIFLQSFYNRENYPSVGACKRNYLNVNPCDESVTEVHSQPPHKRTLTRKITERSSQTKAI